MADELACLESEIRTCTLCRHEMGTIPKPVLTVSPTAKILIAGQAPGNLAMVSGKPFTDPSGVRLRDWMGVDEATFYDANRIAIVPMGFCFPGYDKNGSDIPPLKRCAETWRERLLALMPDIQLSLLVGGYAQKWHLGARRAKNLTETVRQWQIYASEGVFTLPHPSWRNTGWIKRNQWFESETLPALKSAISRALLD
ncbi:MAG: uracil-DNA glycosylase family protein [Hyphomonadaceae bacterium]